MSALNTPETSSSSTVAAGAVDQTEGVTQSGAPIGTAVGVLERTTEGADTTSTSAGFTPGNQAASADRSGYGDQPYQSARDAHPAGARRPSPADRENTTQTLGIIAFVLAMAAVVTPSFVLLPIASLVVGIIALARKPRSKAFALTGVIVSGVLLAGAILLGLGAAFIFGIAALTGSAF